MTSEKKFDAMNIAIDMAERELASTTAELRRRLKSLQAEIERTLERIDNDVPVNNLGVVQSSGPDIDRLCALQWANRRSLETLREVQRMQKEGK